jgi:hypothetical protein
MISRRRSATLVAAMIGLFYSSGLTWAQDAPPHVPLQKSVGQHTASEIVPSLIVMNAAGATLADGKLTLTGVAPNSIVFADRPTRSAGHALTTHLLEEWDPAVNTDDDSFSKNPPNATVSGFSKDGSGIRDAVVVLKTPTLAGDTLTFDVDVLEGDLTGADGPASIFIDVIGMPLTPYSYAGAARRAARRGAWYGVGPVAPVYHPYYHPYYHARCGYYPYPPCL